MFAPGLPGVAPLLPGAFWDMRQMVKSTKAGLLPSEPSGPGTRWDPWVLKTPSGQSEYTAYRDETADPPALVVQVGKTEVTGQVRRRGSSSFEFVDQVLCVSHETLDDTPSLFFGSPDKRSDHHEIVCALNGAEAA
jgi:hypothetical protein